MMGPGSATLFRSYGKQKRTAAADATGLAVLNFGFPPSRIDWVVHRVFVRSAAGQTVRLIVGSDPGNPLDIQPQDEVDAVTANPAVNSQDEIHVESLEPIWVLVTGIPAGTLVSGQIRYRQLEHGSQ